MQASPVRSCPLPLHSRTTHGRHEPRSNRQDRRQTFSPHLFDWPPEAPTRGALYTCAGRPRVVVSCARADWHRAFVRDEVAPRVVELGITVVVVEPELERVTWLPDGRLGTLATLASDLEAA